MAGNIDLQGVEPNRPAVRAAVEAFVAVEFKAMRRAGATRKPPSALEDLFLERFDAAETIDLIIEEMPFDDVVRERVERLLEVLVMTFNADKIADELPEESFPESPEWNEYQAAKVAEIASAERDIASTYRKLGMETVALLHDRAASEGSELRDDLLLAVPAPPESGAKPSPQTPLLEELDLVLAPVPERYSLMSGLIRDFYGVDLPSEACRNRLKQVRYRGGGSSERSRAIGVSPSLEHALLRHSLRWRLRILLETPT